MSSFKVKLYIGTGVDKDGIPLHDTLVSGATDYALKELSLLAAGATLTHGVGSWCNAAGDLVKEDCVIIESIVSNIQHKELKDIASQIKTRLAQESVLLTIEPLIISEFI